ncbi:MAG TPA: hypothetical protein VNG29_04190 [Candidatus Paceibacterota bacterium]|nr:hypothetical protein [Candidatus Paceibacterota bacterium]
MIIFLVGPDDYRRAEKKRWFAAEFKKKYPEAASGIFDFEEADGIARFENFGRGESLFEPKKLAIIENLYEADEKKAAKILDPFVNKKSTTILCSERKSPNKALQFLLEKPSVVQEFPNLTGAEWPAFIRAEARKHGAPLDPDALQFLAQVYAGQSWGLVTELDKLASLGKTVSRGDLEAFDLEVAPNYFAVLNSLKSQEVKNRLWALEKLFATGDPPPKIFNMLASQWKEKIPALAAYDLAVKSGKLEYEEVLVDLVIG